VGQGERHGVVNDEAHVVRGHGLHSTSSVELPLHHSKLEVDMDVSAQLHLGD
jgi:hypothetical protein